jgi:hypothetical protein
MLKDVVGWTLPDALDRLSAAGVGVAREARPEKFRFRVFGAGDKALHVTSDGWAAAGGKLCLKYSRIQSKVADIATLMIYPTASPERLPIFAAEWVVIGERAHALALDVEIAGDRPELQDAMRPIFMPLFERHAERVTLGAELPQWFLEIKREWAIFASDDISALAAIRAAYADYLSATVASFYAPALPEARSGDDHPSVTHYKRHHAVNSPGFALLASKAGDVWTREFLDAWHFGPLNFPVE